MIFKNDDIPSTFNKIAEIGDNYIVWVRENSLQSGNSYQAYIQYFSPSFAYFFTDDYKIKQGDNYVYDCHYTNNGMYSYVDYYDLNYSLSTLEIDSSEITNNDYNRSDFTQIFICGIILVALWTAVLVRILPKTRR